MKKVGLFFGTFNPIHQAHLILANHLVENSLINELWFVISPRSPFKLKQKMLSNNHRYQMVYEAITQYPKFKVNTIEFDLPQPNYTIDTLVRLEEKYPNLEFYLIMGEDNLAHFHKWKNADAILAHYHIMVYPRVQKTEIQQEYINNPKIIWTDGPILELSSSYVRKQIKESKEYRSLVPPEVFKYLDEMNFYRK